MWLDGAMADGWSFATGRARGAHRRRHHLLSARASRRDAALLRGVAERRAAEPEGSRQRAREAPPAREAVELRVFSAGRDQFVVESPAGPHRLQIEPTGPHSAMMLLDGNRHRITYSHGRTGISVEVGGVLHTVERSTGSVVRAPAPAMVVNDRRRRGRRGGRRRPPLHARGDEDGDAGVRRRGRHREGRALPRESAGHRRPDDARPPAGGEQESDDTGFESNPRRRARSTSLRARPPPGRCSTRCPSRPCAP